MKGLSNNEIEVVSFLELNEKSFFTRNDIKRFFKNEGLLKFYIRQLKKKKRIIKINKNKYYLVPVKAYQNKWSENPFIVIDEIFNGNCTNKQGKTRLFETEIVFKRIRPKNLVGFVEQKAKNHSFKIASKEKALQWIKSNP